MNQCVIFSESDLLIYINTDIPYIINLELRNKSTSLAGINNNELFNIFYLYSLIDKYINEELKMISSLIIESKEPQNKANKNDVNITKLIDNYKNNTANSDTNNKDNDIVEENKLSFKILILENNNETNNEVLISLFNNNIQKNSKTIDSIITDLKTLFI